jgi:NADPH:quinone reductase-like Zn-dependent oxidoreductase
VIHRAGREPLEQLAPLLGAGTVVPVIDSTYALEDARRAFERFGTREVPGKVVIAHGAP